MVSIGSLTAALLLSAVAVTAQVPSPTTFPASCQSTACEPLTNKLISPITASATSCSKDVSCLCSNDVFSNIQNCYACAVNANAIDQQTANNGMDAYLSTCKKVGHPIQVGSASSLKAVGHHITDSASSLKMSGFAVAAALIGLVLL